MCQTWTTWVKNKNASRKAQAIWMYWEVSNIFRLSRRSAKTPPNRENIMMGKLSQEEIQTQVEGVFGEIVDQPALCKLLYECANGGGACPNPHKAEITIAKRPEDAREEWKGCAH